MHKTQYFLDRRDTTTTFPLLHISFMQQFLVEMQPLEMNNIVLRQLKNSFTYFSQNSNGNMHQTKIGS